MPNLTILFVDDDTNILNYIFQVLAPLGHEILTVESGREAMKMLEKRFFDVVITDFELHDTVDGLSILEYAKKKWPQLNPTIFSIIRKNFCN